MKYPFTDSNMIYDYNKHRYILTQDCLMNELGVDISRFNDGTINAQTVINSFLNTVSIQVYNYIYSCNNKPALTYLAAKMPSARQVLQDAMGQQALYLLQNGDLSKTANVNKYDTWLDMTAKSIVDNTELKETGRPLSSVIPYCFCIPCYAEGEY